MDVTEFGRITITREEYYHFHSVDRLLYATLVNHLFRDPVEAIQMMAIWMWLERALMMGFSNITRRILTLHTKLINKIGDEALVCWNFIGNTGLLETSSFLKIPITCMLLQIEITTEFLHMYREKAILGINKVIKLVCANCLKDIWERAIERNSHAAFLQGVAHLGFVAGAEMAGHEQMAPPQMAEIHPHDRTLFMTFSKGYPVAEWEIKGLFGGLFGECIQSFYMQEVAAGEQALFAKIVFEHPSYIHLILGGRSVKKIFVNGKHVWMRKFIQCPSNTASNGNE